MIANWFGAHPLSAGAVTLVLMWSDWLLTIWQQRVREALGSDHTRTYPVDTIEGNMYLQTAVKERRILELKHLLPTFFIAGFVMLGLTYAPPAWRPGLLGYVWGLFLIVDTTHIGNLIGYKVCRRGTHGQLWLHQRTAVLVQAGRYAALAGLLLVLAVVSTSPFMVGVACAGIISALRQLGWLRRLPAISPDDRPPSSSDLREDANEPLPLSIEFRE